MKVVSVINFKGGVGKTTVTANLGAELARRGCRVLLIDLDPQASLTFSFYRPKEWLDGLANDKTIMRWFGEFVAGQGETVLTDLITTPPTVNAKVGGRGGRLDLIASHLGLVNIDLALAPELVAMDPAQSSQKFVKVYSRLLDGLAADAFDVYDVVLIDCPPNFNIVTKAAMIASTHYLVPARADDLSTLGIQYLRKGIGDLVSSYNESLTVAPGGRAKADPVMAGVVFTMVEMRKGRPTLINQDFIQRVSSQAGLCVLDTTIRHNQRLHAGATTSGVPLAVTGGVPTDIAAELAALATEFLQKLDMTGGPAGGR